MLLRPALLGFVLALTGCTSVVALQRLSSDSEAIMDDRLLGDWKLIAERDTTALQVTVDGATGYAMRWIGEDGDTIRTTAHLAALDRTRWVLEVTADMSVGKLENLRPMILPGYLHLIVMHPASGLEFAIIDPDSVLAALKAHKVVTPWMKSGDHAYSDELVLTATTPAALRAALISLAARPGALIRLKRNGHVISMPDPKAFPH